MSLPDFLFVTGNPNKLQEAERILGFRPAWRELDLPEIQDLDLRQVLVAKAAEAWRRCERPVVVDETSLELDAMNGFPGPLIKWLLAAMGAAGIARLIHRLGDDGATVRCALLFQEGDRQLFAEATVRGRILSTPRGTAGFGFDPVFVPQGESVTYAELSPQRKDQIGHRGLAWRALLKTFRNASVPRQKS